MALARTGGDLALTRVFGCNGSVQLVASIAAGRTLEAERTMARNVKASVAPTVDRDVIVVHDLEAPRGHLEEFARSIDVMAAHLGRFERVVHLRAQDVDELEAVRRSDGLRAAAAGLLSRLDLETADELYAVQNPGSCQRLLFAAFPDSRKICYGDGIGINFTPEYFAPHAAMELGSGRLRSAARRLRRGLRRAVGKERARGFDTHVLLLPNLFDEHLVHYLCSDPDLYRRLFADLRALLDDRGAAGRAEALAARIEGATEVIFLLSTNFSESGKMDLDAELAAYVEAVTNLGPAPGAVLVLKPHPRDAATKIARASDLLAPLFRDTVILDDPLWFHLPFEVILDWLLGTRRGLVARPLCFSTACLSLELLYGMRCTVGFGEALVRRHFRPEWVEPRLRHERDLDRALETVRARTRL